MIWKRYLRWEVTRKLMVWLARICPEGDAKEKMLFACLEILDQEMVEIGENPKPLPERIAQIKRNIEF